MKRHGFTYKKPKKVPARLNPLLQEDYLKQYEQLKVGLKAGEEIFFLDAVHPDHQTQDVHGWIRRGSQRAIPTTGTQRRLHFIGGLNRTGERVQVLVQKYEKINTEAVIDFVKKLWDEVSHKKKLYLILDQAGYHRSNQIKDFLKRNPRIKFIYLPPYSPNLNLIERLWKLMRENVTHNRYYSCFKDFTQAVNDFFEKKLSADFSDVLSRRMVDVFQPLKPDFLNFQT